MFVIDESSKRGARRMRHLAFEDFLEAVVRFSRAVPLPTDAEIAEVGCNGAAQFMAQLVGARSVEKRNVFEDSHQDNLALQSAERCVAHAVDLLAASLPSRFKRTWKAAGATSVLATTAMGTNIARGAEQPKRKSARPTPVVEA